MTKVIRQDTTPQYFTMAEREENRRFYNLNVHTLDSLVGVFPNDVKFKVITPYPPADYFVFGSFEFVSEPLKNSLDEEEIKAEFFPVEVTYKGIPLCYYYLHYMHAISCVDDENSIFELDEDGDIEAIERLVLKEDKINGENLFRVEGASFVIRAISDSLAEKLRKQGFTGIKFYESTVPRW